MMLTRAIFPLAWGAGMRPGEEFFPMPNGLLVADSLRADTRICPQGFCSPRTCVARRGVHPDFPRHGASRRPAGPATFVLMFEPADVLDGLNDDQRRAATYQSGPLLVLAGAGTGKTRTLVARAGWLRSQGTPASRILLLTFTRRAADDMLARVTPRGASAADRVVGGTFHAVAHQIIRAHAESFSLPPEFSVIDPPDVTNLMDTLRAENGLVTSQRRAPRAGTCADIYTRCVNTRAPVPEVIKAQFPWVAGFETELAGLFRAYTAHKRQHGLVDFDDLLLLWRAALADPAAGPVLRAMFDAVLVDEYQDVNAVQADIVRLLRPDGQGLTCVGDDAQAIYAFRGADPAPRTPASDSSRPSDCGRTTLASPSTASRDR